MWCLVALPASNLVAGDNNNAGDVFLKAITCKQVRSVFCPLRRVVEPGNGWSSGGSDAINANSTGDSYVVLHSSADSIMAAGETEQVQSDIFLKNVRTGAISLVSVSAAWSTAKVMAGLPAGSVSADGLAYVVLFVSDASNLVAGDNSGTSNAFIKDMQTGAIRLPF
jgi:hypothetical protein